MAGFPAYRLLGFESLEGKEREGLREKVPHRLEIWPRTITSMLIE